MELTDRPTISHTVSCDERDLMSIGLVVKDVIGTRTITQFCEDSGLSVGYVSRLLNGKLKTIPKVRTLARISCSGSEEDRDDIFRTLLNICGHDLSTDEVQREIQIVEDANRMIERKRYNYVSEEYSRLNLSASAVGLLFSRLMVMGASIQPLGYLKPYDGIEFEILEYPFKRIVAIPGFCTDENYQMVVTERDILELLLRYVSGRKDTPMYLVLTNQYEVYKYVTEVVERNFAGCIYVLLSDNEHTSFIKQSFFSPDDIMTEPILDFVNDKQ